MSVNVHGRLRRVERRVPPPLSERTRRYIEHVADVEGVDADELLAEAKRFIARCHKEGAFTPAAHLEIAARERGCTVEELRADIEGRRQRWGTV